MKRKLLIALPVALLVICAGMMFWLNSEPATFDPIERAKLHAQAHGHAEVTGAATAAALLEVVSVLLNKRGGYMSNDILPPWVFLDNVPNWELGALAQVRDLTRVMRNDFSRSQTQSTEDPDLTIAEPQFNFDNSSWMLPSTESEYGKGMASLEHYLERLVDENQDDGQFYARADNLRHATIPESFACMRSGPSYSCSSTI